MTNIEQARLTDRLFQVCGFEPWDGWGHVITQLEKGRIYCVSRIGDKTGFNDRFQFIESQGVDIERLLD